MFEHKKQALAKRSIYVIRIMRNGAAALGLIALSLAIGMVGYHGLAGLSWIDAYEEAAMILSGMGPTSPIISNAGKIFSGVFALYSGLVLIFTVGIIAAPIVHRFFHRFHLETDEKKKRA